MNIFLGNKIDRQHIRAIRECKLRDDKLVNLFEHCLNDVKNQLVKADDIIRIHRLQGQASVLEDFLAAIEKSGEVLERRES
jgi:hypothetical protein